MKIKGLIDEDFVNYKLPSMYVVFPYCTFKCGQWCQNANLKDVELIDISPRKLAERYADNPITQAVVCAGLEPFDSFDDLLLFVEELRKLTNDDIVIYTGYDKVEVNEYLNLLKQYRNIVVKFGRYLPPDAHTTSRYDETLGVILASNNQYAERIS